MLLLLVLVAAVTAAAAAAAAATAATAVVVAAVIIIFIILLLLFFSLSRPGRDCYRRIWDSRAHFRHYHVQSLPIVVRLRLNRAWRMLVLDHHRRGAELDHVQPLVPSQHPANGAGSCGECCGHCSHRKPCR